jgi:hypothetical protein
MGGVSSPLNVVLEGPSARGLPSFELISGVTHAILDEVATMAELAARSGLSPGLFRHAAGQIRDEGLVKNKAA